MLREGQAAAAIRPSFSFQAGASSASRKAGLERMNRSGPIAPPTIALATTTPPNEWPTATSSTPAAKIGHGAKDRERVPRGREERGRVGPEAAQPVSPLRGTGGGVRIQAMGGGIEHDRLPFDLLDHGPPRQHLLQGVARGQAAASKLQAAQLGERVVLVSEDRPDAVLGAQVAEEEHQDEDVGLVAADLEEARGRDVLALGLTDVAEVLHLEEAGRALCRDPGSLAAPGAGGRQPGELPLHPAEPLLGKPVEAVVQNPGHELRLPRAN